MTKQIFMDLINWKTICYDEDNTCQISFSINEDGEVIRYESYYGNFVANVYETTSSILEAVKELKEIWFYTDKDMYLGNTIK